MVLEGALVELLTRVRKRDREDVGLAIGSIKRRIGFFTKPLRARVNDRLLGTRASLETRISDTNELTGAIKLLSDEIFDLGLFADIHINSRENDSSSVISRDETLDHSKVRAGLGIDDKAGEKETFTSNEMNDFDDFFTRSGDGNAMI